MRMKAHLLDELVDGPVDEVGDGVGLGDGLRVSHQRQTAAHVHVLLADLEKSSMVEIQVILDLETGFLLRLLLERTENHE